MSAPLVSVVMPVRDGGELVEQAARSILAQTFTGLELVIVDDGSKDATTSILRHLAREDDRVVVIGAEEPQGIARALNDGCDAARGRYLARMDADDISLPRRLELQVGLLEADSDVGLVGGQMISTDLGGSKSWPATYPTDDAEIRRVIGSTNPFGHPTVTMRKELFEACGGYRGVCRHAEDYDLWVRMLDLCRGANVPETVLLYRVHPGQTAFRDWRQHCLSTLAVEASVRIRRSERRDPLEVTELVTEATVRHLGVSEGAVRTRFVETLLSLSNLASHAGSPSERHRLLAEAIAEARRGPLPEQTIARLALTQGLAAFEDGAWLRGTANLIRSIRADRKAARSLAADWLYRHHRWIFRIKARLEKLGPRRKPV